MLFEIERLKLDRDGRDWPNHALSRLVDVGDRTFHIQETGSGPGLLLLHGTGASTHSWRDLIVPLGERFHVLAPDLPGLGFSDPPAGSATLPRIASTLAGLLNELKFKPALVVGHSAGAAIALRMALDGAIEPKGVVSLNGALFPFRGLAAQLFPSAAKLLFVNPVVPRMFSLAAANRQRVERLIADVGSQIDERGIELYQRLFRSPGHVAGTLAMMANWDLDPLIADLPNLKPALLQIVGDKDKAVSPADALEIRALLPTAGIERLREAGHLAHEEQPQQVIDLICAFAQRFNASG